MLGGFHDGESRAVTGWQRRTATMKAVGSEGRRVSELKPAPRRMAGERQGGTGDWQSPLAQVFIWSHGARSLMRLAEAAHRVT